MAEDGTWGQDEVVAWEASVGNQGTAPLGTQSWLPGLRREELIQGQAQEGKLRGLGAWLESLTEASKAGPPPRAYAFQLSQSALLFTCQLPPTHGNKLAHSQKQTGKQWGPICTWQKPVEK